MHPSLATVLTIAGSDTSAGAGIQADLKTIHALGGYALTAITAITAQNSQGVQQVYPLSAQQLKAQLKAIFDDYEVGAIKIGMLANTELCMVVAEYLHEHPNLPVILDPIMLSSSGKPLLDQQAMSILAEQLIPKATLITPNLPELNQLLNTEFVGQADEIPEMLKHLIAQNWPNTLVKGGHSHETLAVDYLLITQPVDDLNSLEMGNKQPKQNSQEQAFAFPAQRIHTANTHGTGCTLSSAIATQLAFKQPLPEAIKLAKDYLQNTLVTADYAQPNYRALTVSNYTRHGGLNHFGQSAPRDFDDEEE